MFSSLMPERWEFFALADTSRGEETVDLWRKKDLRDRSEQFARSAASSRRRIGGRSRR